MSLRNRSGQKKRKSPGRRLFWATVKRRALRVRHLGEYLAVRLVMSFIQAVSIETCQWGSRWLAWIAADVVGVRRKIVLENLLIAFPDSSLEQRKALARRMWEHLLLMICEIAHAPRRFHETNWQKYIQLNNRRGLVRALLVPKPSVVVTAHFGNFEVGGYVTGFWGFRTYTVARPLDNPYLDAYVNNFRQSLGQRMLPKDESAEVADELLAEGGTLVLVGDHHAGSRGVWIEFMGKHASCHKALALFTLLNKAPMSVILIKRNRGPGCFDIVLADQFDPEVPGNDELRGVTELTQWYNDVLEREIRIAPDQYWWLHRRWREAPPERKRRKPRAPRPAPEPAEQVRPAA
ncbi:MAG: lysophospholipid acyltransferase family protein [Pirellulaceae bacterium]|nr:lysophospholipid acyltransferase family protein [Pirellulaceae bacterium]